MGRYLPYKNITESHNWSRKLQFSQKVGQFSVVKAECRWKTQQLLTSGSWRSPLVFWSSSQLSLLAGREHVLALPEPWVVTLRNRLKKQQNAKTIGKILAAYATGTLNSCSICLHHGNQDFIKYLAPMFWIMFYIWCSGVCLPILFSSKVQRTLVTRCHTLTATRWLWRVTG